MIARSDTVGIVALVSCTSDHIFVSGLRRKSTATAGALFLRAPLVLLPSDGTMKLAFFLVLFPSLAAL